MDDFKRMMAMEGVRSFERPKSPSSQRALKVHAEAPSRTSVPTPGPAPVGYVWVNGSRARTALETALERLAIETQNGRRGWATGIRQNGTALTLPTSSGAASLLGAADRQSLRVMLIGGDGWTFVMHPTMGVATLDEDPT